MGLGPNQKRWLEALRSGEYKQTTKALCADGGFCCLGVGCELFCSDLKEPRIDALGDPYATYDGCETMAPSILVDTLALRGHCGESIDDDHEDCCDLATLNDTGHSFTAIADLIEKDPSRYFIEEK